MTGPGRPSRRRRASRLPRIEWPRPPSAPPLRGREWAPGSGLEDEPRPRRRWRAAAAGAALAEVALLAILFFSGAFRVQQVVVTGNHRLTAAQVRSLAALDRPSSVFAVDPAAVRHRLTAAAWIRDARVSASMPGRVDIAVEEWQPVAVFVPGPRGRGFYLSDQAVALGPAPAPNAALEIDAPAAADPRAGQRPLDPRLLTAFVNIKRGLPALVGQDVRSFEIDGCGNVTMTTQRGWKAYFGRVITPEEFAGLNAKLAALKAVSTAENLNSPDIEYVNLMNPSLPAVGPRPRPAPTPARGASPAPSPAPPTVAPVVTCR